MFIKRWNLKSSLMSFKLEWLSYALISCNYTLVCTRLQNHQIYQNGFLNLSVEVDDPEIIKVTLVDEAEVAAPPLTGSYSDITAYRVTCLAEGESAFLFLVGNTASATNK